MLLSREEAHLLLKLGASLEFRWTNWCDDYWDIVQLSPCDVDDWMDLRRYIDYGPNIVFRLEETGNDDGLERSVSEKEQRA